MFARISKQCRRVTKIVEVSFELCDSPVEKAHNVTTAVVIV